jgi:hypothetical protein
MPIVDGRNGYILNQAFSSFTRLGEIGDIITLGLYPIKNLNQTSRNKFLDLMLLYNLHSIMKNKF